MRAILRLFPRPWRDRYGEDLLEQLGHDPRRATKWVDAVRTAAALRWAATPPAVLLVGALGLALASHMALGVGMDERIGVELLRHWWGAPFVVTLALSAFMAAAGLRSVVSAGPGRGRGGAPPPPCGGWPRG